MIKCDHWAQVEVGLNEISLNKNQLQFIGKEKKQKQKSNKH